MKRERTVVLLVVHETIPMSNCFMFHPENNILLFEKKLLDSGIEDKSFQAFQWVKPTTNQLPPSGVMLAVCWS